MNYTAQGDANTLATANGNAQGYANNAQNAAVNFASGSDQQYFAQAQNYANQQVASAQSSNTSTYSRGVRLSGTYSASNAGRLGGSVCVAVGSSSASNYAYLQYNINGTWYTAADA